MNSPAIFWNYQFVIEPGRTTCSNSGQRVGDHIVEITGMIGIGKGQENVAETATHPKIMARRAA